ncbi:MAG: hypothetical protein KDB01_12215 [Planctomycetaceae bacterium]|nr:hypothetical protein [Planctomycetaceae bacterium]
MIESSTPELTREEKAERNLNMLLRAVERFRADVTLSDLDVLGIRCRKLSKDFKAVAYQLELVADSAEEKEM